MKTLPGNSLPLLVIFAFFFCCCCAPAAQAQGVIGLVEEIAGEWYVAAEPPSRVSRSHGLPAGAVVRAGNPGDSLAMIVILLRDGRRLELSCAAPGGCAAGLRLPRALRNKSSVLQRLWDTATRLIYSEPDRYGTLATRGGGLSDAVVRLQEGGLDLSAVLKNIPPGAIGVQLKSLAKPAGRGEARAAVGPIKLAWDPSSPPPFEAKGIGPGVYEVHVFTEQYGVWIPMPGAEAWVLLSTPGQYARHAASFDEAVRQFGTLAQDGEALRALSRAYLDHLSNPRAR